MFIQVVFERVLIICLLDYNICLLDLLYNFKRIYAFDLHIFLLQKLHG
jgi:hypothetical protein